MASSSPVSPFIQNAARPFEIRLAKLRDNELVMEVWQYPLYSRGPKAGAPQKVARLWGLPLHLVWDYLGETLRKAGWRPQMLSPARRERQLRVTEEVGVRIALLGAAVAPLRKFTRIQRIAEAISLMSYEEVCYWYAHVRYAESGRRALRALRLLLADE